MNYTSISCNLLLSTSGWNKIFTIINNDFAIESTLSYQPSGKTFILHYNKGPHPSLPGETLLLLVLCLYLINFSLDRSHAVLHPNPVPLLQCLKKGLEIHLSYPILFVAEFLLPLFHHLLLFSLLPLQLLSVPSAR